MAVVPPRVTPPLKSLLSTVDSVLPALQEFSPPGCMSLRFVPLHSSSCSSSQQVEFIGSVKLFPWMDLTFEGKRKRRRRRIVKFTSNPILLKSNTIEQKRKRKWRSKIQGS